MSLAWTVQRAAPTPLTAIALVFRGVLDNIDMRSRQLLSGTRPTLCPESSPDPATAAASTPGRHAWLSHPGFQQLHDHPLPPLVRVSMHARVCKREIVCVVGGMTREDCKLPLWPIGLLFIVDPGAVFNNATPHDDLTSRFSGDLTPFTLQHHRLDTRTHTTLLCFLCLLETLQLSGHWTTPLVSVSTVLHV